MDETARGGSRQQLLLQGEGWDGRERGGGDDATTDVDDDDDDDNDNNDNKNNNSNSTIKQCMGVRGRRKTVVAMDGG